MNFSVLFTTVSTLSFVLHFEVDINEEQTFFQFQGDDGYSSAQLKRVNDMLTLNLKQYSNYENYVYFNISEEFSFSWENYKINNDSMFLQNSYGQILDFNYNNYIFYSPSIDISNSINPDIEPLLHCTNAINYGYIAAILLAIVAGVELKQILPQILKKIKDNPRYDINLSADVSSETNDL